MRRPRRCGRSGQHRKARHGEVEIAGKSGQSEPEIGEPPDEDANQKCDGDRDQRNEDEHPAGGEWVVTLESLEAGERCDPADGEQARKSSQAARAGERADEEARGLAPSQVARLRERDQENGRHEEQGEGREGRSGQLTSVGTSKGVGRPEAGHVGRHGYENRQGYRRGQPPEGHSRS